MNTNNQAGETRSLKRGGIPPFYTLEKPTKGVEVGRILAALEKNPATYRDLFEKANVPAYLHWETFKHKFSSDSELSVTEKWYLVQQLRRVSTTLLPMLDEQGTPFSWVRLPTVDKDLHAIDMFAGGRLVNKSAYLTETSKHMFLTRGIIEESIASSQLEGAHTTRKAAKQMLVERKKPKNESEQMILNNFTTITAINERFKDQAMNRELLFEIHAMLTEKTIPDVERHRFRTDADEIVVQGQIGHEVYVTHTPPSESFVEQYAINRLIKYANDELPDTFVHPILKAIFLHFWIGYLHPFTDGNGRLARALFYWYLLRKGYWTAMYLPISTIIKKAPLQYAMAYLYAEQDNNDVTYFYDFHIKKIVQAIAEFERYLSTKFDEKHLVEEKLSKTLVLNERQKQLVYYLVSEKHPSVTTSTHARLHATSRQTAMSDLKYLEKKGLIRAQREGKYVRYYPTTPLVVSVSED